MTSEYSTVANHRFLLPDLSIAFSVILIFTLLGAYADRILLGSWLFIFFYLLQKRRIEAFLHLLLSTLMASIWVHFAKDYYGYKFDYLTIFGMNTLPLMAWTLTLLGVGEVCNQLPFKRKIFKFLIFVPVFWVLLILFETVAYHILEIRNTMTSNFIGLPYCDCIHAPVWMQVVYFTMSPVYYGFSLLTDTIWDSIPLKLAVNKSI
ncbi:MAG: hypothetical protein M0Q53_04190 [Prolixibacteraceae bacterium]|jgi:hypothetical protein|nr:hypothetical protein [Prolixibacteraceae bacterium]